MRVITQLAIVAGLGAIAGAAYLAVDHFAPQYTRSEASATKGGPGAGRRGPRVTLVDVASPQMRAIEISIDAVGTSRARQSIEVVGLADGRIAAIEFKAGQKVAKGEVLVRLDTDIEEADVAQAAALLKEAELAMQRARTLQTRNAGKQSTVDEMVAKLATARAGLDRAQRRLKDRTVRAPFDGVVGIRRVDVGARVDNKSVLTTLDDLAQIDIDFLVPEDRFANVALGQRVAASTAAFPGRTFEGKVSAIDSRIDQVGRAFKVRATIPNPEGTLPAGLFMLVKVVMERRERLTVPEEAIVPEAGRNVVFVVQDGKAVQREVKVGQRERGIAEVSGLTAEDAVVVKGFAALRDGAQVRIAGKGGAGKGKGKGKANDKNSGKRQGKDGAASGAAGKGGDRARGAGAGPVTGPQRSGG